MSLSSYITDLNIYSSLESVADRCTVALFIPYGSPDYASIPDKGDTFVVSVKINDAESLAFRGLVKEREFAKEKAGYRVTLHLYDKASVLLDTHFRSAQKVSSGPFADMGGPPSSAKSTTEVVGSLQAAMSGIKLMWNLSNYQFKESVSFDSDAASVLRQLAGFFSATEIQKVVLYCDGSPENRVIVDIVDLWKARISKAEQLDIDDRRDLSIVIGETRLPEISKLLITGATDPESPWKSTEPTTTTVVTEDQVANLRTEIRTIVAYDSMGRIASTTVVTLAGKISTKSAIEIQRESTEYTYTKFSNRAEKEVYSLVVPELTGDILRYKLKEKISTAYTYDSKNRLKVKASTTREYDTSGKEIISKLRESLTTYTVLARGLTRRREDTYVANVVSGVFSEKNPLKLKTSAIETFYGDPPTASLEAFGPVNRALVFKAEAAISANPYGEIIEYSNPHLSGGGGGLGAGSSAGRIIGQVKELSKATRLDISISMIGTPDLRKGGHYAVQDFRPGKSGNLNFVAVAVTHSLTVGLSYTTTVQGVCYE